MAGPSFFFLFSPKIQIIPFGSEGFTFLFFAFFPRLMHSLAWKQAERGWLYCSHEPGQVVGARCCQTRTRWHVCRQPSRPGWRIEILEVRSTEPRHQYYHRGLAYEGSRCLAQREPRRLHHHHCSENMQKIRDGARSRNLQFFCVSDQLEMASAYL